MANFKELEHKQKELLVNLSEEELKQYIELLTKNYYVYFFNDDARAFENNFKQLEEVYSTFKGKYSDLNIYINSCLLKSINNFLTESLGSGIPLNIIGVEEDYLEKQPFSNLINAFEESRALYLETEDYKKRIEDLERRLAKYERVDSNG